MSQAAIANGYLEAQKIVAGRRMDCVNLQPVWAKLNRINKYLDQQAAAELAESLN